MNEVQWALTMDMYPLQLANPRVAFDGYVKTLLNKFVPEVNGILLRVHKQTFSLKPAPDLATSRDTNSSCLIRLHPEQPIAKVEQLNRYFFQ